MIFFSQVKTTKAITPDSFALLIHSQYTPTVHSKKKRNGRSGAGSGWWERRERKKEELKGKKKKKKKKKKTKKGSRVGAAEQGFFGLCSVLRAKMSCSGAPLLLLRKPDFFD